MNLHKLREILDQKNLSDGIKEMFIKTEDDYFKQAVIIISQLPQGGAREGIIDELDDYFQTNGYELGDFVRAVESYDTELKDLVKKIMG